MIDKKNFKLSVIIPCYNEKKTIQAILEKVIESLNNYKIVDYEIIIVDDSSDDGTKELLNEIKNKEKIVVFFHETNLGKGAAIQTAIQHLTGDITNFILFKSEDNSSFEILTFSLVSYKSPIFFGEPTIFQLWITPLVFSLIFS